MSESRYDFSNSRLDLSFRVADGRLRLDTYSAQGFSWLFPGSPASLFRVTVDGKDWDATNLDFDGVNEVPAREGFQHVALNFHGPGFSVEQHIKVYAETALVEVYPVIINTASLPVQVRRVDSIALNLAGGDCELFSFTGNWGSEFEPQRRKLSEAVILESRSGRSSKGNHPWFALIQGDRPILSGAVAWSGNWCFRFEPSGDAVHLSGGLHDWQFWKTLQPGESMDGAPVVLVLGETLDAVSQQYASVGRKHWYPRNTLSAHLPVEWNHWWPYEDAEINEMVFQKNVVEAEKLGFDVCTLDAGWFGPADAGTFWEHYRGDWHLVNEERFPGGLRALSDFTHAHGMKFGIWCEIEGLGEKAQVAVDHPEYVALRDGARIGCVCFGNPAVQEWAYQTLARLITEYRADWIKVDFNLDPGAGCNRTDHGHQDGDGLYEHYLGYYRTLERIHADFPEVVLENCSSGGLRIDLGMLRRTFMTFLSDPDWPVHDLQIFWGASTMLAPDVLLHWTYSHWRNLNPPPYQKFNPHSPDLTPVKWDYYTRISMLGLFGLSQRLPDMPVWMAERVAVHNTIYQNHVRRFVQEANLYRLTEQPRRSGEGDRWCAFQYSLPDESEHLVFVFRLPGAEPERAIKLKNLQPDRLYAVRGFEGEPERKMTGAQLMGAGLRFDDLDEESSVLLKIA